MLISITIPVFNNKEGLIISIQSLFNQSYSNWEAIVIDDGSVKSLKETVVQFNDSRIIFHRFSKNSGRPVARQKSFELLNGNYCGFLDAGDYYESNYLKDAVHYLKTNEYLAVSQSMLILYKGKKYFSNYVETDFDVSDSRFNKISFASTIINSKVCLGYKFNKKLRYSQDRHFLNYIAKKFQGKVKLLNTNSYVYDQGNSITSKTTFLKYYYDFVRINGEKKGIIESVKAFCKIFIFYGFHLIFGYEKILKYRFKVDTI